MVQRSVADPRSPAFISSLWRRKDLSKLPEEVEERSVESEVQRTLLQTLSTMHYNAPAIKAAAWPKRNEELPPGASYTCGAREGVEDGQPQREQQRKQQEWV
jgi:hypothetical protein